MSKYNYTIDGADAVSIFVEGQEAPIIFQPTWPDTTAWADAEEAATWAQAFISSMEDPEYEFVPGFGPEEPLRPKPEPPVLPEVPASEEAPAAE